MPSAATLRAPCLASLTAGLVLCAIPSAARAEEPAASAPRAASDPEVRLRDLAAPPGKVQHWLGSAAFGSGLRFNNPYRLSRVLGDDAESMSLTSGYVDLGAGYAFGPATGLSHGAALRLSFALSGVGQAALAPTYLAAYRQPQTLLFGRLGPSILLSPDANVGGEAGLGAVYFFTGAVGASAELVFDLFYGAGTLQSNATVYPILSGQLGLFVDYEVLP